MRFISRLLGESDTDRARPVPCGPVSTHLHPAVEDASEHPGRTFTGATLRCRCEDAPVTVEILEQIAHPRLCGCTRCWKPEGALFAYVGFVSAQKLRVTGGQDKLDIVDPSMPVRRRVCIACNAHLFGLVEDDKHAFHGLALVYPDRAAGLGWAPPAFASYCSSLIEAGMHPDRMADIRAQIERLGLVAYDCLSPDLMDRIAEQRARNAGVLP